MRKKIEILTVTFKDGDKEKTLSGKDMTELLGWIEMAKEKIGLSDNDFSEIKTMILHDS